MFSVVVSLKGIEFCNLIVVLGLASFELEADPEPELDWPPSAPETEGRSVLTTSMSFGPRLGGQEPRSEW